MPAVPVTWQAPPASPRAGVCSGDGTCVSLTPTLRLLLTAERKAPPEGAVPEFCSPTCTASPLNTAQGVERGSAGRRSAPSPVPPSLQLAWVFWSAVTVSSIGTGWNIVFFSLILLAVLRNMLSKQLARVVDQFSSIERWCDFSRLED